MEKKPPEVSKENLVKAKEESITSLRETVDRYKDLIDALGKENKKLDAFAQSVFGEFDVCSKQDSPAQIIYHFGIARERLRQKYQILKTNNISF